MALTWQPHPDLPGAFALIQGGVVAAWIKPSDGAWVVRVSVVGGWLFSFAPTKTTAKNEAMKMMKENQ